MSRTVAIGAASPTLGAVFLCPVPSPAATKQKAGKHKKRRVSKLNKDAKSMVGTFGHNLLTTMPEPESMTDSKPAAASRRIRVLVTDSARFGSQLMLEALRQDNSFEVVGVTAIEALSVQISRFKPDVAVFGVGVNGHTRTSFDSLRHALAYNPKLQAVVLLDSSKYGLVVEAFRAGARGIICWDAGLDALRKCVYAVHLGQIWASSAQLRFVLEIFSNRWAPETVVDSNGRALLSKREIDVVRCVSQGMTNREIAWQLKLSEHTVKNYLFRTFDKLGISNRTELILYALNHSYAPEPNEPHRCGECAPDSPKSTAEHGTRTHAKSGSPAESHVQ